MIPSLPPSVETAFFAVSIFLFGLAFGSFLNVCIYRLPRGMSVVHPRSACPKCKSPVRAYDNIPVLSWLILGGRCRDCKNPISVRYPTVELMTGLLFLACFLVFGPTLATLKYCIFSFLILGLIFTDADLKLLPDAMTLPGLAIGLVFSFFVPVDGYAESLFQRMPTLPLPDLTWRLVSFANSLIGTAIGAFFIWSVGFAYEKLRGVEGMGFGDVKLMAMVGAFLGVKLTILTILLGSLTGSFGGVFAMIAVYFKRKARWARRTDAATRAKNSAQLIYRHYQMPFGIFLGAMALFCVFFGMPLVRWYMGMFPQ